MGILLDGRHVARSVYADLRVRIARLPVVPRLIVILVGDSLASLAYIAQKQKFSEKVGIAFELIRFASGTPESEILVTIDTLNARSDVSGFLVQLPLPVHFDTQRIIARIDPHKDVDGFTDANIGDLFSGRAGLISCTPHGVMRLLAAYDIPVCGRRVVVLGQGNVGKPMVLCLVNADATVISCNSLTSDIRRYTQEADIVISATGCPHLLGREHFHSESVVVDVGFSVVDGRICGDVDYEAVHEYVRAITPVPGGIGPMTVAMLLENVVLAAECTEQKRG